jgi:hypothetical protein
MVTGSNGSTITSAARVLVRVTLYYAVVALVGAFAWRYLPRTRLITSDSLDALFGGGAEFLRVGRGAVLPSTDQGSLAITVFLAMLAAAVLTLPVAWIYTLTRARRGYQQSLVQLLIVLPTVIAGVMVLVKYSIALAFGLGGVVAAVRFRNTLDDSKDAAYVFLVTGIGIAAAVDLPVAMVISVMFNALVVLLWMTDFGRTPVALDGRMGERRLERARQLARTGTFVARIDDEVLRDMTAEQLEGVAQRAWHRARAHDPDGRTPKRDRDAPAEMLVRVHTRGAEGARAALEAQLEDATKRWTRSAVVAQADGTTITDYLVTPKKRTSPEDLLARLRAVGGAELVDAEVRT